jgi:hypothetical protein
VEGLRYGTALQPPAGEPPQLDVPTVAGSSHSFASPNPRQLMPLPGKPLGIAQAIHVHNPAH